MTTDQRIAALEAEVAAYKERNEEVEGLLGFVEQFIEIFSYLDDAETKSFRGYIRFTLANEVRS